MTTLEKCEILNVLKQFKGGQGMSEKHQRIR